MAISIKDPKGNEEDIMIAEEGRDIMPGVKQPDAGFPKNGTNEQNIHYHGQNAVINYTKEPQNSPKLPKVRVWVPYNRNVDDPNGVPKYQFNSFTRSCFMYDQYDANTGKPIGAPIKDPNGAPKIFVERIKFPYVVRTEWQLERLEDILATTSLGEQGYWMTDEEIELSGVLNAEQPKITLRTGVFGGTNYRRPTSG